VIGEVRTVKLAKRIGRRCQSQADRLLDNFLLAGFKRGVGLPSLKARKVNCRFRVVGTTDTTIVLAPE
jgi:hypothetical protein